MRRTIFGAHLRNWLRLATLTAWRGLTRRSAAPQRRSKPRLQRAMRSSRFSTRIRSALISPECQFLIPQMRHWISIVERQLDPPPPPVVPSASDWSGRTWLILVAVAFAALVAFLRLASHPDAPGTRSQLVNPPGPAQPAAPHCDPYGFNSTCPELRLSGPHTPPAPQLGSP